MYANGCPLLSYETQNTAAMRCLGKVTTDEIVLCEHQEMDGYIRRLV